MANTPELTPEPQDFPPVASTSLLEPTSSISEGAHHTVDPATAEEIICTSIGVFEQFVREYDQQVPHLATSWTPSVEPWTVNPEVEAMKWTVDPEVEATISRSPRIVEQWVRDHGHLPSLSRRATPMQSELDLDEKNYKLVLALEHMQYVQERMLSTDPTYLA